MNVDSGTAASKTEAVYYPAGMGSYEVGDAALFKVPGPGGEDLSFLGFTKEFKYLGSIVNPSLTSDAGVDKRTRSLGAYGTCLETSPSRGLPGAGFMALVLTVLLYGSEVWCLRKDLLAGIRSFHNRCCRAMCRITMEHTRRCRIPSGQLYGASLSSLRKSIIAAVCPAGRATCRACPWTGFHGSCLQVSSRTPGQRGPR